MSVATPQPSVKFWPARGDRSLLACLERSQTLVCTFVPLTQALFSIEKFGITVDSKSAVEVRSAMILLLIN